MRMCVCEKGFCRKYIGNRLMQEREKGPHTMSVFICYSTIPVVDHLQQNLVLLLLLPLQYG